MRIAILGAGNLGTALARRLVPHGHEIMLSYSRDSAKLEQTATQFGCAWGTPQEACNSADVIVLTVPWAAAVDAIGQAGSLKGKILWDCTNPLKPDMSGLMVGTTTSGGEEVATLAAGALVVKGIPPFAELLHSDDPMVGNRPVGVFVAGNDSAAKTTVSELMAQLPSCVTDAGGLDASRLVEPAMGLLVHLAYRQGLGPRIALDLIR